MKALTICQPYAEFILRGVKRVENRTWSTRYRGPLLIHAGKSREWMRSDHPDKPEDEPVLSETECVFGAIVGVATVVDCVEFKAYMSIRSQQVSPEVMKRHPWLADHEHSWGPWCWVLENVRRFTKPIPYRGAQGFFDVPREVIGGSDAQPGA
jgi:hypothetical protein